MRNVVLIGDSIFDNGKYVPGESCVVEQLGALLEKGGRTTLLAVDGSMTADVREQVPMIPRDATHLDLSSGGIPLVLDLRPICSEESHYSDISPIEPSALGGAKMPLVMKKALDRHDFASGRTTLYR